MGQAAVSVQHFQDGAEEESPGGAGCPELLWHHQQGTAGAQNEVHDQHQAAQWVANILIQATRVNGRDFLF